MNHHPVAVAFVQHVIQQHPHLRDFGPLYDAMSRTASARSFRRMGYAELARVGISFALFNTGQLEQLINEILQRTAGH
jgi:hypothetical protein